MMKEYRVHLPEKSILATSILAIMLLVNLCCLLAIFSAMAINGFQSKSTTALNLGYNFARKDPELPGGDQAAATHLFIHQYPFPQDGLVTGIRYLQDDEALTIEIPESIYLVVLHPEPGGLRITHLLEIPADDQPPSTNGIVTYTFPEPIKVQQGDVYGHWQPSTFQTGPIPFNTDSSSTDGLTLGKSGFEWMDIQPGTLISLDGFTGRRDYYLNLIFQPDLQK